jgi:hypothetical protein
MHRRQGAVADAPESLGRRAFAALTAVPERRVGHSNGKAPFDGEVLDDELGLG